MDHTAQNGSDRESARYYRYVVFAIISLTYVLVYFHRLCPAVIAVDIQNYFKVSGTLLGLLSSAYFYPYAIMQLPAGLLMDSWGPRKTVSLFLILAALGSAIMGLTSILGIAVLGRVMVGIGVSTVFVSNFKLLTQWFEPSKFAIMGGIFMAMGGVGVLLSTAPLAWISNLIGWRMTFVTVGLFSLIMASLVYKFVFNSPPDKGWPAIANSPEDQAGQHVGLLKGLKMVLTERHFWPMASWNFFVVGVFFALAGLWGGPFLMHVYGLSKTSAGGVLSMSAVGLVLGGPFLGVMSDHFGRKTILAGCSLVLTVVCFIFYFFTDALSHIMLYILFFSLCVSTTATAPVVVAYTKELFPLGVAGTSVGLVNLFPFLGGAFFQVVFGAVLSQGGQVGGIYPPSSYQNMFLLCLISAIISFLNALLFRETFSRQQIRPGSHGP
ncbi:MAG: MFS transporter [Desulfobacteraceae bacterium]|nr:MFS transporter [Desulfobacteraceae bacterium]